MSDVELLPPALTDLIGDALEHGALMLADGVEFAPFLMFGAKPDQKTRKFMLMDIDTALQAARVECACLPPTVQRVVIGYYSVTREGWLFRKSHNLVLVGHERGAPHAVAFAQPLKRDGKTIQLEGTPVVTNADLEPLLGVLESGGAAERGDEADER